MITYKRKWIATFLAVLFMLGVISNVNMAVYAGGENAEQTQVKITDFHIEHSDGSIGNPYDMWERFNLKMTWDASMYENTLHEGDFFNVDLPQNMKFPTNSDATKFDIFAPDGNVVAKAAVTPKKAGGGTIKVTFSNYVENRHNIKGTMKLAARFKTSKITVNSENKFSISVNAVVHSIDVHVDGETELYDEILVKWGDKSENENEADWHVRINHKKGTFKNVVLKDKLLTDNGELQGMHYLPDTFILREVVYNEMGGVVHIISEKNIGNEMTFNPDLTEFQYNIGDINGKQYQIEYKTTYIPGRKLKNTFNFKAESGVVETFYASYQSASSNGTGQGNLLGKIRIIKVDKDNNDIKLSGAKFLITRLSDNSSFELKSNEIGEAVSERLLPGKYLIKEIEPPVGYLNDPQTYTVTVTSDEATIKTVTNERIKINIHVEKKWIGEEKDSVTVNLLADGKNFKTITLTKDIGWKYTFSELPKFDNNDGHEIVYKLEEVKVDGYITGISGTVENGFTITNTITGKTSVTVTKRWIGKVGDSAKVYLLADGSEVDSIVLNQGNNWQHSFDNLDQYKDGKQIKYTIKEASTKDYTTQITGDSKTGFLITNKEIQSKPNSSLPKTGDGANPALYAGILLSICLALVLERMRRKSNK